MLPFLIDNLGQRYYGMWTLIGSIIAYLGYMDFGLSKATQNFIARAIGKNSAEDANRILTTSLSVFSVIGVLALAAALIGAIIAPVFLEDPSELFIFRVSIVILGLSAAISFPLMAFNGFFSANLRYDVVVAIETSRLLIRSGFLILVLQRGHTLIAMSIVVVAVDLIVHAAKLFILRRMYSEVKLGRHLFDRSLIRPLYSYGGKAFLHNLADLLRFQIDILVVGAWLNLSAVAVYSVAGSLAGYFRQLLGMVFGVTVPVYAQLDATENTVALRDFFRFSSKLATIMAVFLAGNTIVFGGFFIDIWLGSDFSESYLILVILLVGALLHVSQEPALALLYGLGEHGRYAGVSLIEGIINVGLSIILVTQYGTAGVAAATSICTVITAGFAFWTVAIRARVSLINQLFVYGTTLLFGLITHAAAYRLVQAIRPETFSTLFGVALPVACIECIAIWLVLFNNDDRSRIQRTIFRRG
jgi:O-antigen/teichoic acid export membrane protein